MSLLAPIFQAAVQQHQAGRLAEAEAGYRRVLAADPEHADSLHLLGVVAAQCGHAEAAVELIGQAIRRQGRIAAYHINLGLAQQRLGRTEQAEASYRRALALDPDGADALNALGMLLQDRQAFDEAAAQFERCLAVQPDHEAALVNLTLARRNQGRLDEAITCGRRAVEIAPGLAEAHNNLGLALENAGHAAESLPHFRTAMALRPDYLEAVNNYGLALQSGGQDAAAIAAFEQVLAADPSNSKALLNQAMVRLLMGDYAKGWEQYEARWTERWRDEPARDRGIPRWDGTPGAGRSILLWWEQGLGDTLQFCRYAPLLAAQGWRVTLEVQAPVVRLLQGQWDGVETVATDQLPDRPFDAQVPLLSLPRYFATVPAEAPYIRPDPSLVAEWGAILRGRGLKQGCRAGLVWAGNPYRNLPLPAVLDQRRSIPLARLVPLLALDGCQFVSLQKEPRAGEDPAAFGLIDPMPDVRDFADTAAIIANLDRVVAVDTSTLHLAAAMGKPAWLLNRFETCWRWLRGRDDSPWYPTLRQFRQPVAGDWDSPLTTVAAALQEVSPIFSPASSTISLSVNPLSRSSR